MTPPAPNPADRALAWARHRRDDWLAVGTDPALAPEAAFALLAIAGECRRHHYPEQVARELTSLQEFLHSAGDALLAALQQYRRLEGWSEDVQQLDEAWAVQQDDDAEFELESASIQLLTDLDENDLALWAASRLPGVASQPWLAEWRRERDQALEDFTDHLEAFLPAAPIARQILAACRPDLDDSDWELFETTLKLSELVELEEAIDESAPAAPLTCAEREAVQRRLEHRPGVAIGHPKAVLPAPLALAAHAEAPTTYRQLVWHSPDGKLEARLRLPDRWTHAEEPLRLRVFLRSGSTGVPLPAGQSICLGGHTFVLDPDAQGELTLRQLQEARTDLILKVDGRHWLPVIPTPGESH